jgi:RhtB (resistance to homoserine/threonine) family protein
MSHLQEFFAVVIIHFLGLVSPGPDFIMTSRNSMVYSRRTGVYSSLGLSIGILVHVTYCLLGIGFIISRSILLFNTLKYLGAAYLIYIGFKCLRSQPQKVSSDGIVKQRDLPAFEAIRMGFLTNISNPKVTLFMFGLFTQVIHPDTPLFLQVLYGLEMSAMTFLWFSFVATVLSVQLIRQRFSSMQHILERIFGGLLIALGVRVALERSR